MFKNKIAKRLILYILVFSSAITLVLTAIQLFLDYRHDIANINQRIQLIKVSTYESLKDSIWRVNYNGLRLQLEGLANLPDIVYLEVRDGRGKVLASVGSFQEKRCIDEVFPIHYQYRDHDLLLGNFKIVASLDGVYQRLLDTCLVILISQAIKTFLVSAFIFFLFQSLVTRHLAQLADYAKGVDSENLAAPFAFARQHLVADHGDELDQLADAVNSMRNNLALSYARLRSTLASLTRAQQVAHIGNWQWDLATNGTTWSEELCRITGCEPQEYDGTNEFYLDCIHPGDKERFQALKQQVMAEKKPYHEEYRIVRRDDGAVRHVREDGVVSVDEQGNITSILGTVQDITGRKIAEEELLNSRALLLSLINSIPDLIFYKDRQSAYLGANQAFADFVGRREPDIVGKTDFDFFPTELAEFFRKKDRQMLAKNVQQRNEEWVVFPDGRDVLLDTLKTSYYGPDGEVLGLIGISRDITEQRAGLEEREKLNRQLQQSQKMESIGTLAGGIAHDFNNILSAIMGYTELAQLGLPPESKSYTNLNEVMVAGKRATALVRQILAFSRITEEERQPVQLALIIKEALKLLRASIPTTIEIKQNIPADLGSVLADPTQIHQVVMNLCTNAYHAMLDTGGVLEVILTPVDFEDGVAAPHPLAPGKYLKLAVSDTGCGMDIKTLERVFDPYFTTKGKGKGTGLGLSVVHGIVKSHGGDITVASQPGQGTVFEVCLPVVASEIQPDIESAEEVRGGNERILLVDDEKQLVALTQKMLEDLGYHVTSFASSTEALQEFCQKSGEYDLVISDMTMPGLTGMQLAQKLTQVDPGIPIVIFTGLVNIVNREDAETFGVKDVLLKPVSRQDLAQCVRAVLDKK